MYVSDYHVFIYACIYIDVRICLDICIIKYYRSIDDKKVDVSFRPQDLNRIFNVKV